MNRAKQFKIPNALIGNAGVYRVASELSRKGLIALPTVRNTAGIDMVVMSPDGSRSVALEVKTSQNNVKFWPIGARTSRQIHKKLFFVFLRTARDQRFETFIVPSQRVAKEAKDDSKFAVTWYLPTDEKDCSKLRDNWKVILKELC